MIKYSSTLLVVNYHSDHCPISVKQSYWIVHYSGTSVHLTKIKNYKSGKNMNCKDVKYRKLNIPIKIAIVNFLTKYLPSTGQTLGIFLRRIWQPWFLGRFWKMMRLWLCKGWRRCIFVTVSLRFSTFFHRLSTCFPGIYFVLFSVCVSLFVVLTQCCKDACDCRVHFRLKRLWPYNVLAAQS